MQRFILLFFIILGFHANAQEVVTPLGRQMEKHSRALQEEASPRPLLTQHADTLELPFFDDFTRSSVYPTDSLWADRLVYVNHSLGDNPPSFNVATFDGYDQRGVPYNMLQNQIRGLPVDTFTSRYIDLSSRDDADSIYLSFAYQSGGVGNAPEDYDSLVLLFRTDSAFIEGRWQKRAWKQVWAVKGGPSQPFKWVVVPVQNTTDATYFYGGFQFRFVAYGNRTGNLDHWNLDYIYMERDRRMGDSSFQDVAISYPTRTIVNKYTALPWEHAFTNLGGTLIDEVPIHASNNENFAKQVRYYYTIYNHRTGEELYSSRVPPQVANMDAYGDTTLYQPFSLPNFPAPQDTVQFDIVTGVFNPTEPFIFRSNDSAIYTQTFTNYYAYDDGIAEGGYGIRESRGQVAQQFTILKADTLRGVWIYFNRSENDVSNQRFSLKVWEKLTTIGHVSNQDKVIAQVDFLRPAYRDTFGGFVYFPLDAPVPVSGSFYVGWEQTSNYVLNVGLDRDYKDLPGADSSNIILYNTSNKWAASTQAAGSALMIRPLVGPAPPASIAKLPELQVKLYPNPATDYVVLSLPDVTRCQLSLYDLNGRLVKEDNFNGNQYYLQVGELAEGMYLLKLQTPQGTQTVKKVIVR